MAFIGLFYWYKKKMSSLTRIFLSHSKFLGSVKKIKLLSQRLIALTSFYAAYLLPVDLKS